MTDRRNLLGWRPWVELIAWAAVPALFLALYVLQFHNPARVVFPHLFLVASFWAGGVGLRALAWQTRWPRRWLAWISATLAVTPWAMLVAWNATALLGLYSWGRVTTWPMIRVYGGQYAYLLDSLGYPAWIALVPAAVLALVIGLVAVSPWPRPDWASRIGAHAPSGQRVALPALLVVLPLVLFGMTFKLEGLHAQEPISLTFIPRLAAKQSNAFSASPATNAAETAARDAYRPAPHRPARNVILIVGDALRADHMGVYGYHRDTTPFLSSLAKAGHLEIVPRIRSVCSESLCGFTALAASRPIHTMPSEPFVMHDVLRRNGYRIHMLLSGDHTNFYGLRAMYGPVDSYFDGSQQQLNAPRGVSEYIQYINDDQIILDRLETLPDSDGRTPVMMQFVLMSSHGLGPRHPHYRRYLPQSNYYAWMRLLRTDPGKADRQGAINYYDNGILQLDDYVRMLLERLQAKGYLDDALVVVTGDHGEMLGEHGLYSHAIGVHEPVLGIPMLLARFGYSAPPLARREIASQIDIAPTILQELGIPAPSTWEGIPLQEPTQRSKVPFQQRQQTGTYDSGTLGHLYKYWKDFSDEKEYLYDVRTDPSETRNLIDQASQEQRSRWRMDVAHGALQVSRTGED